MKVVNIKPLKSIKRSKFIPNEERGKVSYYDLKPGLDLGDHIKGSHLIYLGESDTVKYRENKVTGHKQKLKYGKFKCKLCGNTTELQLYLVLRGTTRSCGCMGKYEEFKPGETFGYLTILDEEPKVEYLPFKHKNGQTYQQKITKVPVECLCGNKTYVKSHELRTGRTVSCGKCYNPELKDSYKPELHKICKILGKRYDKILSRTRRPDSDSSIVTYGLRKITLDFSLLDFIKTYYKQDIDFENLQVDRIDNDKSYTLDNIRWVTPSQNMQNTADKTKYTELSVSYRLLTDIKFDSICKAHNWSKDRFQRIEFPLFSTLTRTYNLFIDKMGILEAVDMVYYYIDLMRNLSDNMTTDTNRRYLHLVDQDNKEVPRTAKWKDGYKVIINKER